MVSAKLVNGDADGFLLFGLLVLTDDDGNAIDEEDDIRTIAERAVGVLPLLCRLKDVIGWIIEINEADVYFSSFGWNVHGLLATHPFKSFLVSFDGVAKVLNALDNITDVFPCNDFRIEFEQLLLKDGIEEKSSLAVAKREGFVPTDYLPTNLACVFEDWFLDCGMFGKRVRHWIIA